MIKHVKWLGAQRVAVQPPPLKILLPKKSPCPPGYTLDPRRDKCVPAGTGKKNR